MTLGLPGHLVQSTLSRALARSAHWFGLVCLTGALLTLSILSLSRTPELWVTVGVILGMAALLVALAKHHTLWLTLAYLVLGGGATYLYAVAVLSTPDVFTASNLFLLALPKMALVMVGGAGTRAGQSASGSAGTNTLTGVLWASAGFVIAEAATVAAIVQTDVPYRADLFTLAAYLLLTGILLLAAVARRRSAAAAQLVIHRAVQDDATRTLRHELDHRAVALLNDTAVSALVALAHLPVGPVPEHLLGSMRDTVHTLTKTDWLTDADTRPRGDAPEQGWQASALYGAVEHCRDRGLHVDVTGDTATLRRLDAATDRELGLAVQQCLVNVILHAGIAAAEVRIDTHLDLPLDAKFGPERPSLAVMVTDAGRGFTESESAGDRLGLRQSVRRRIEQLGGSVVIWTRPGAGTSVLLSVPLAAA
ncbi:MAG: ATP-binding protein, partial [Cryobacterium sp.]